MGLTYAIHYPAEIVSPVTRETTLYLAPGRPKVNINKDFHSLNRLILWWSRV